MYSTYLSSIQFNQNILHPTNKIQCDICKKDISKHTKILTESNDYCVGCFSNLEHSMVPLFYYVINKIDFPLFQVDWTADEELLMFEGLEKYGICYVGMGLEIGVRLLSLWEPAKHVKKSKITIPVYISKAPTSYPYHSSNLQDNRQILSKRDPISKKLNKESTHKILKRKSRQQPSNTKNQRGYLTVNQAAPNTAKTGTNPA